MFFVFLSLLFLLWAGGATYIALRATKRLFEFDTLFQMIVDPMHEYRNELAKIASAEGLLHDHPEVMAFHRANMIMLEKIDAAIKAVQAGQPQPKKPEGLPPQVV